MRSLTAIEPPRSGPSMLLSRWPLALSFVLGSVAAIGALVGTVYVLSLVLTDVPYIHRSSTVLASQQFGTHRASDFSTLTEGSLPDGAELSELVQGLEEPVSMAEFPDGRLMIAERGGQIWLVDGDSLAEEPVLTVGDTGAQRSLELGLLGIAVRPADDGGGAGLHLSHRRG